MSEDKLQGVDLEKLPFNYDNFEKAKSEIRALRDLILKQNAVIATKEVKKAAPKAKAKASK